MPKEAPPQAAPGADDAPIRPAALFARQPLERYFLPKANQLFQSGDFSGAHKHYLLASQHIPRGWIEANIVICAQRIARSKVSVRSDDEVMGAFDAVFLVNLERQPEKRLVTGYNLLREGISFRIFKAIDGYQQDIKQWFDVYLSQGVGSLSKFAAFKDLEISRKKRFLESPGAVGYLHTYISILRQAQREGLRRILIFEDDVILVPGFKARLARMLAKVPEQWKVIQLGASQYNWTNIDIEYAERIGWYLPRRIATCGSFAIALDCSVFDELIELASSFEAPFDFLPLGEIYERYLGECFVLFPNLVMPDVSKSTIRGDRCQHSHAAKMKWRIEEFGFPQRRPRVLIAYESCPNEASFIEPFEVNFAEICRVRLSKDGWRPIHDMRHSSTVAEDWLSITPQALQEAKTLLLCDEALFAKEAEPLKRSPQVLVDLLEKRCREVQSRAVGLGRTGMPDNPLVSVIITTFKRTDTLRDAIESVITQSYSRIETIVVSDNDPSSDYAKSVQQIVQSLSVRYPFAQIHLIQHSSNRNGAAARNTGIFASQGDLICFLDDDDIYLPGRIELSVEALRTNWKPNVGAVYCGFKGWNAAVNSDERYPEGDLTYQLISLNYRSHYVCTNTVTYLRDAVISLNGFDESFRRHQDLEFNIRFFQKFRIISLRQQLVHLNPKGTVTHDNKLDALSLALLKRKFFLKFERVMQSMPQDVQQQIIDAHWREVARYAAGDRSIVGRLKREWPAGAECLARAMNIC